MLKSLNTLACLYDMEGKLAEARPIYERCLGLAEKLRGPQHETVAAILDNLATVDHALGKEAGAEAAYKRALAIREKAAGAKEIDLCRPCTISRCSTWRRSSTLRPSRSSSGLSPSVKKPSESIIPRWRRAWRAWDGSMPSRVGREKRSRS